MSEQNFVDYVKILFRSGKGGAGSVHFWRDKINPKGGPDGGDGGHGGHIILVGNRNQWTLLPLKYRKHIYADDGVNGSSNNKTGADGADVIVEVPLGTVAINAETGEKLLEITSDGEKKVLMSGGRGGQGNTHFKTAVRQTPRFAQPGEMGEEAWIILELKVLADVGLVGFPNAGKSTLLSAITAATPKIGDYPFTTLTPNLGIVGYRDSKSFVMADIPGIIEHAHEGRGLGLRFLRHIERNSVLLFMIPCTEENIAGAYAILLRELTMFNEDLLDKPRMLAITKSDLVDGRSIKKIEKTVPKDIDYLFISSVTGKNLTELKDKLWQLLNG